MGHESDMYHYSSSPITNIIFIYSYNLSNAKLDYELSNSGIVVNLVLKINSIAETFCQLCPSA
jgi:hypothetical protein